MKKKYMNPISQEIRLETTMMLALSTGGEYTGGPNLAPRHGRPGDNGNYDPYDDEEEDEEEDW